MRSGRPDVEVVRGMVRTTRCRGRRGRSRRARPGPGRRRVRRPRRRRRARRPPRRGRPTGRCRRRRRRSRRCRSRRRSRRPRRCRRRRRRGRSPSRSAADDSDSPNVGSSVPAAPSSPSPKERAGRHAGLGVEVVEVVRRVGGVGQGVVGEVREVGAVRRLGAVDGTGPGCVDAGVAVEVLGHRAERAVVGLGGRGPRGLGLVGRQRVGHQAEGLGQVGRVDVVVAVLLEVRVGSALYAACSAGSSITPRSTSSRDMPSICPPGLAPRRRSGTSSGYGRPPVGASGITPRTPVPARRFAGATRPTRHGHASVPLHRSTGSTRACAAAR